MTETAKGIYQSSVPFSILLQELSLVIPENVRLQSLDGDRPGGHAAGRRRRGGGRRPQPEPPM